jgi:tRNA 2-(methylsulfanyl)-N6-isopentenyladenosine37 hydroxylase
MREVSHTDLENKSRHLNGKILRAPTDPVWVILAVDNFDRVLVDHAHCEKKASAAAMSLVAAYPDRAVLVRPLIRLAREELKHLEQVCSLLSRRGLSLGRDPGDPYARSLLALCRTGEPNRLVDRLLVAALIEARSCERLGLLGEALPTAELRRFYSSLANAEAGHHRLFVELAVAIAGIASVEPRLAELAIEETRIVARLPRVPRIH